MLDSNDALVDEFISRNMQKQVQLYTTMMIFDAYYTMNKSEWINQENKEYRDNTERRFKEYFEKHEMIWNQVSEQDKMMISNSIRSRSVQEGMPMESITIKDWLEHVKSL